MIDIYEIPTLPTYFLRTSSSTSGGPLAPSGSFCKVGGAEPATQLSAERS